MVCAMTAKSKKKPATPALPVPVHAGEILKREFLEPMGLSVNFVANAIFVTPARLNDIALQRRGITGDTAIRLAKFFGTSAEFWLNIQKTYELRLAEQQNQAIFEQITPYKPSETNR